MEQTQSLQANQLSMLFWIPLQAPVALLLALWSWWSAGGLFVEKCFESFQTRNGKPIYFFIKALGGLSEPAFVLERPTKQHQQKGTKSTNGDKTIPPPTQSAGMISINTQGNRSIFGVESVLDCNPENEGLSRHLPANIYVV